MNIRDYTHDDYCIIKEWLDMWNIPIWEKNTMPKIGKVVYRHNKFFAFGFLRGCEQGLGMIESLIGNPIISRGARNKAVDMIMEALIDEADKKGMKSLLGLTIIPSLEKKVIETYGFKKHSCSILVLNRGEGS